MTRRRRDDRVRIAPGIYRGEDWLYGTVYVRGAGELDPKTKKRKAAFREKRFPLAVSLVDVEAWQSKTRAQLLEFADRGSAPGSFTRDAKRYLTDFTQHLNRGGQSVETCINPWIAEFGDRARGTIKPADVARTRSKWLATKGGPAPKTINDRVAALARLYRCLDGKKAWTPCDDLDPLEVHRSPIRVVDDALIRAVDLKLQEREREDRRRTKKTRARFRVLVATGRRPSELMRTQPGDVDLQRRVWLPRDGKGGFSPGIYLNDDMLAAWQFFVEVDAWGEFSTQKQAQRLRKAGWPEDVDPYQARHTVGITLSERGVDLKDVGDMMGHKHSATTRRHYVPVLNSRMQKASEMLEGRFGGWPAAVHSDVHSGVAEDGKNRPVSSAKETKRKLKTTREK